MDVCIDKRGIELAYNRVKRQVSEVSVYRIKTFASQGEESARAFATLSLPLAFVNKEMRHLISDLSALQMSKGAL